jgi:NAD(P)-dependent dehydrogenase (short-subunit alcohol dehydrogenase family)
MKIKGKIALITGGTKGIGAETAVEMAKEGAHLVLGGLPQDYDNDAKKLKEEIEEMGLKCLTISGDLSKVEECRHFVKETIDKMGALDILIHTAGGRIAGGLMDVDLDDWYRGFDVHIHAILHLCREAYSHLKIRGEGAVILVSSIAGIRGCTGAIGYDVVKGAIPQFTRDLALEFAEYNIRVNAVAPGIIRTRFQDYLTQEKVKINIDKRIPLHREGKPKDVAETILMLIKNEFITGETIVIDGGMSMRIA